MTAATMPDSHQARSGAGDRGRRSTGPGRRPRASRPDAGSTATRASVARHAAAAGLPVPGAAAAAATTPARIRGIGHRNGVLRPALAADLVARDQESCLPARDGTRASGRAVSGWTSPAKARPLPGNQPPGRSRCRASTMPSRSPGHGKLPPLDVLDAITTAGRGGEEERQRLATAWRQAGDASRQPRLVRQACRTVPAGRLVTGQPGADAGRSAHR